MSNENLILDLGDESDLSLEVGSVSDVSLEEQAEEDLMLEDDSEGDIELSVDGQTDLIIEDALPYSKHYQKYTGSYIVVPMLYTQRYLMTADKLMTDNVTIEPIPIAETTNVHGGTTVVIG